ncbi:MAG: hypothetical protein PWQ79_1479 [Thermococcaceae archaeon]|nr:hypothetical protein [Thermococcaceae archaeon]MDK2914564.1 hypothetical protein [Thermococcaceae archaeon]
MTIRYEPLNRRERILKLFREALEAENRRDLDEAKKKLDEVLHESMEYEPDLYFEACFRLADIFIQEENYRGAVKMALRGMSYAPREEQYALAIKRLGDILAIIKDRGALDQLATGMENALVAFKDDENIYSLVEAIIRAARGEKVDTEKLPPEFREILYVLTG